MDAKQKEFGELVKQYSPMLYRYAFWLSKSEPVAQDLLQETFMRAWRSFDQLKKKESAKYWLITILRRENARRFEGKQLIRSDRDVDTLESPYGKMEDKPEALAVRQALAMIPIEYREPLVLQVLCGYTCKEIARMLEITPEAVMTRLYRARHKMRDILEGDEKPQSDRRPS